MSVAGIEIRERPALEDDALNALFSAAWPGHAARSFGRTLAQCLTYFGAFRGPELVGFVKVAWDGGQHAFLLDPTVHPSAQRQGLGSALVRSATASAAASGAAWLHVDYEPSLAPFYAAAGFRPTAAGLIALQEDGAGARPGD
jgi:ribosomal protein S18 acetylase RimI-like enzyme